MGSWGIRNAVHLDVTSMACHGLSDKEREKKRTPILLFFKPLYFLPQLYKQLKLDEPSREHQLLVVQCPTTVGISDQHLQSDSRSWSVCKGGVWMAHFINTICHGVSPYSNQWYESHNHVIYWLLSCGCDGSWLPVKLPHTPGCCVVSLILQLQDKVVSIHKSVWQTHGSIEGGASVLTTAAV